MRSFRWAAATTVTTALAVVLLPLAAGIASEQLSLLTPDDAGALPLRSIRYQRDLKGTNVWPDDPRVMGNRRTKIGTLGRACSAWDNTTQLGEQLHCVASPNVLSNCDTNVQQ